MVYNFALLCALMLAGLAYASMRTTGRADSPATLLCGIWAFVLGTYWLSGDIFYPVDYTTIVVIALAPATLFIGAMLGSTATVSGTEAAPEQKAYLRASVVIWTIILLVGLPAYYKVFAGEISGDSDVNFIAAIRIATLENEGEVSDFSPVKNLQPFSYALPLLALVAFSGERLKATLVALFAAILAICYGLLTGSKSVIPSLAVSICIVLVAKNNGRVRGSGTLPILAIGVFGFLALIRYVNYTFAEDMNEWDLWVSAIQGIASYLCAPIPGLDFFLASPEYFDLSPQSASRPFYYIANSILHMTGHAPLVELPSLHLKFFDPGPGYRGADYNTYSYLGTYIQSTNTYLFLLFPLVLGILLSKLHRRTSTRNAFALLVYAYVARALPLSFNGEMLVLDIANIIKFAVVVWVMVSLTPTLIAKVQGWLKPSRTTTTA